MGPGYGGYNDLISAIEIPLKELDPYSKWKDSRYTRNCISSCEDYELLLLCWGKGHSSPIHNFSFQEGWIKVLEGELTIERYEMDREKLCCKKLESIVLKVGESSYINDNMGFHRVLNSSENNARSIHLNIGPVTEWEVFRECRKETMLVQPITDSESSDCD